MRYFSICFSTNQGENGCRVLESEFTNPWPLGATIAPEVDRRHLIICRQPLHCSDKHWTACGSAHASCPVVD